MTVPSKFDIRFGFRGINKILLALLLKNGNLLMMFFNTFILLKHLSYFSNAMFWTKKIVLMERQNCTFWTIEYL